MDRVCPYRHYCRSNDIGELNEKKADEFPETKIDRHSLRRFYEMRSTNTDTNQPKPEVGRGNAMDARKVL